MPKTAKKSDLTAREIRRLEARYSTLASELGSFPELSQGSVMPQPPRAWRWTRKVAGKTVTVGLSPLKAQRMKLAIANHRKLEKNVTEMREITQKLILRTPDPSPIPKREPPPKSSLS